MSSDTGTDGTSGSGGAPVSVTPSTALLNRKLGISPGPRMLTRSEIDLLRQSAKEIAQATRDALELERTEATNRDLKSCKPPTPMRQVPGR